MGCKAQIKGLVSEVMSTSSTEMEGSGGAGCRDRGVRKLGATLSDG